MRIATRLVLAAAVAAIGACALTGCGASHLVKPKRIAFEPTIVGCSSPSHCTSGNRMMIQRFREASRRRCPREEPNVLIKANGELACVAALPSSKQSIIGLTAPRSVRADGAGAIQQFTLGQTVTVTSGCLACHRIAEVGNASPGPDLTHVGARLPQKAIERTLVASPAPMPSFRGIPASHRRALAYFLAHLR